MAKRVKFQQIEQEKNNHTNRTGSSRVKSGRRRIGSGRRKGKASYLVIVFFIKGGVDPGFREKAGS